MTNRRVLFEGRSGSSRVTQQVSLQGVSGLDAFTGWDIQVPLLVLGVMLVILSLMLFGISSSFRLGGSTVWEGVLFLAGGIVAIVLALQKCFKLRIYSSDIGGSGITLGSSPTSRLGNGALYTITARPTYDTDRMIAELGALVQDLQARGDAAVDDWRGTQTQGW